MPPSDSSESKRVSAKAATHGAPPPEQEQLPCPRCDSTNTKFCYYNNYNFSQPRHFCKSCRRYWTHGGTLRDIPVGGGTRKSAKRSRTNNHSPTTAVSGNYEAQCLPFSATPMLLPLTENQASSVQFCDVKGNGSFTSLLNNSGHGASGFLALGGFGLGLGQGFEEVGFGHGRGMWPFVGVGVDGAAAANGSVGNATVTGNGNTWQYESGAESSAFVGGECFSWPDLAISTPGNGLK